MADRLVRRDAAAVTAAEPFRLLFVCDRTRLRRWQLWLAEALAAEGRHSVGFSLREGGEPLPSSVSLLMTLERLLYSSPSPRASDMLDDSILNALPLAQGGHYDLAIDFTGRAEGIDASRILRPTFDFIAGEAGAIAALLDYRLPRLGLAGSDGMVREIGACAVEDPVIFSRALDGTLSRMGSLLLAALRKSESPSNGALENASRQIAYSPTRGSHVATFLASGMVAKAAARLTELLGRAPSWAIAWRNSTVSPTTETLRISIDEFTRLQHDGKRYYADPFIVQRAGVAHVFCEEVSFATGKGVISHFTIDPRGHASTPRPVLEQPYHLSYPFVFERGGETWMVPESSANRTVELYRAERFPDRWVKHAILLDNVLADDATLFEREGRLWLFAAIRDWQASSWGALGLYCADEITGPWKAHPANPVLLDPSAARPAGSLFMRGGQIIRPAQDCAHGYGKAIAFCRIDRLDEEGFVQSVLSRVTPRTKNVHGLHTYNRAGNFEVIDIFAKA